MKADKLNEPRPWRVAQWLRAVTLVMIFQGVVLLAGFHFWRPNEPVEEASALAAVWVRQGTIEEQLGKAGVSDPTLLALPHRHGFSAEVWDGQARWRHDPWKFEEPPRWLRPDVSKFGSTFREFVESQPDLRVNLVDQPPPLPAPAFPALPEIHQARSQMRVEGAIASRQIIRAPELPIVQYEEIIGDTVVRVMVRGSGEVLSSAMIRSSGMKEADDAALKAADSILLAPVEGEVLQRGYIVFDWLTTGGPPGTNTTIKPSL